MSTVFLILSGLLFIVAFGFDVAIESKDPIDQPMYQRNPVLWVLPKISGFILPIIPWYILTSFNILLLALANIGLVLLLGPVITRGYQKRFASGRGFGKDMLNAFIAALVLLILGWILS